MRKISGDIKAGIWYTIGNFINRGIAFVSTPVFTRLLSKEDYGEFSNFTAWATLLGVVTSIDLYASVSRAYYDYEEDFDTYMSTISWLSVVFSAFCYLAAFLFRKPVMHMLGMDLRYMNMLFVYLIFAPASQFFMIWQRMRGKYMSSIFVSVGSAVFSLVLSVITVLAFQDKVWARVVGYVLPVVMVNLVLYGIFFSRGRKFVRERAKYALMISVPMIPHHLSGSVLNNSDRFVIKYYCGNADLAVYSFAYNCALVVSVFSTSVNQAYVPWMYRKLKENDVGAVSNQGKKLFLFFHMIVLGVMLFTPELVCILGGKKYRDSVLVIPAIMLGCCFQFFYTYYVNLEIYCKKTITVSVCTLCAAGANLALNFLFVPQFGYTAAAVTTLISYAMLCFMHYMAVKKLPYKNLYDHKTQAGIIVLFSIGCGVMPYLYKNAAIRGLVILIYLISVCCITYKLFRKEAGR